MVRKAAIRGILEASLAPPANPAADLVGATELPCWWGSRLRRSASVALLEAGALFCERTQRLSALNDSARHIWAALDQSGSCAAAAESLRKSGAPVEIAHAYVLAAATEWLGAGFFAPQEALDAARGQPHAQTSHRAGPLPFTVRYFGGVDTQVAQAVFGMLPAAAAAPALRFDIVALGGFNFILCAGAPLGMHAADAWVAALKAQVTEQCCRAASDGFLTHGALLSANGRRALLSGAPGAGKTTLALALAASGFAYGGDDIVHVHPDGTAEGVPFAAAAKQGAWGLLERFAPQITTLPIAVRPDGKRVRYLAPKAVERDRPGPIDAVLLLSREAGAGARLEPVEGLEALCALLDSGFSGRGRIAQSSLQAFAASIDRATCRRLVYEDLDAAVATVRALLLE